MNNATNNRISELGINTVKTVRFLGNLTDLNPWFYVKNFDNARRFYTFLSNLVASKFDYI